MSRLVHRQQARRRRSTRTRKPSHVVLTARDLDLLVLIALNGYVASEQLAREFFPSRDRCQRRLRQLFDAGLVQVHLGNSTQANLLTLTREGLATLREHSPDTAARIRLHGPIRQAGVAHHLGLVAVRCFLAHLAGAHGGEILCWSNANGPLHQELRLREHFGLVPDAVAEVVLPRAAGASPADSHDGPALAAAGNTPLLLALEVDRGTEGQDIITDKLAKYRDAFDAGAFGEDAELWLLVTGDAGLARHEQLRRSVTRAGLGHVMRLLAHADVCPRPATRLPELVLAGVGAGARGRERAHGPLNDAPRGPQIELVPRTSSNHAHRRTVGRTEG